MFVKGDTSNDFGVLAAGANEATIGISQEGTEAAPIPGASTKAASAGKPVRVHGLGEVCLLMLGGTVTRFDYIKSGAAGVGITAATTGATAQEIGAQALQSGVSGEKILVQVVRMTKTYPALS